MLVEPNDETDACNRCGNHADIMVLPIDASWIRDNGPIFVRNAGGDGAVVHFKFNGWATV